MDKATELIIIAVDVIITALVMVIAFSLYSQGQNLSNLVSSDINASASKISQIKYTKYEGMTVSGAEVLSFCRNYGDSDELVGCLVILKDSSNEAVKIGKQCVIRYKGTQKEQYESEKWPVDFPGWETFQNQIANTYYINPAASFDTVVTKDKNSGLVNSITFKQEKYLSPVTAANVSSFALNGGSAVQGISNADLYTGHNASGSVDSSDSAEGFAEQEESSEDLDVLFSDSKKQKETDAGEWTLSVVTNKIDDLTDDLVSVKSKLAQLSAETIDQSMVDALLNDLHSIEKSISEIKSKCKNSSELTDADRTTVYSSLKSLEDSVISVKSSVQELNTSLSEDVVEESEEVTR